jgi:GNAT superfamily N-acetyltransferase
MDERVAGAPAAEVGGATLAEVTPLAAALAAAFEDDPIFGWLLPAGRRYDRLLRFFTLELRDVVLPAGSVWMSPDASGACLELPPGRWRMPLRTQALHAPRFAAVFGRSLPRALVTITRMERGHLREPHLYVPYIGVAPDAQGAGLGTKLLRRTLDRADAEGLPTYLEATSEKERRPLRPPRLRAPRRLHRPRQPTAVADAPHPLAGARGEREGRHIGGFVPDRCGRAVTVAAGSRRQGRRHRSRSRLW